MLLINRLYGLRVGVFSDNESEYSNFPGNELPIKTNPMDFQKISGVLSKIKSFSSDHYGTFDYIAGEEKEYKDGYCVSFHQNEPDENGNFKSAFGRYTDEEYDKLTNELAKKYNLDVNIGYYGNPEVSFWTPKEEDVFQITKEFNQESYYDVKKGGTIPNPFYDPKKNPMKVSKDEQFRRIFRIKKGDREYYFWKEIWSSRSRT